MSKTYRVGLICEADNFQEKGAEKIATLMQGLAGSSLPGGVIFRHVIAGDKDGVSVPHFGFDYRCEVRPCRHGESPSGASFGVWRDFRYSVIVESPSVDAVTDLCGRIFRSGDVRLEVGPVTVKEYGSERLPVSFREVSA